MIIEKTEGNPFFMEETVQVLLDEGALVRNGADEAYPAARTLKFRRPSRGSWPRVSIACRRIRKTCSRLSP